MNHKYILIRNEMSDDNFSTYQWIEFNSFEVLLGEVINRYISKENNTSSFSQQFCYDYRDEYKKNSTVKNNTYYDSRKNRINKKKIEIKEFPCED